MICVLKPVLTPCATTLGALSAISCEFQKQTRQEAMAISTTVADSDALQKTLLFTPGRLTGGIEPPDDSPIAARDGSYAESFRRRSPALVNSDFEREAMERERMDRGVKSP
jgi:hypothetical protein